jgi:hypothetical protein
MTFDINTVVHKNPNNWEPFPTRNVWIGNTFDNILEVAAGISIYFTMPSIPQYIASFPTWLVWIFQIMATLMIAFGSAKAIFTTAGIFEHGKHKYVICKHCQAVYCLTDKELVHEGIK